MAEIRYVNPGPLRLSPNRLEGADTFKLVAQSQEFKNSFEGMPPLWVVEAASGELVIYNGVTRATRAFLAAPDVSIPVEVIDLLPFWDVSYLPTVADVADI